MHPALIYSAMMFSKKATSPSMSSSDLMGFVCRSWTCRQRVSRRLVWQWSMCRTSRIHHSQQFIQSLGYVIYIDNNLNMKACVATLSEEQATAVRSHIWGFLSLCLKGTARS